jgi:hypothetical protein
VLWKWAGKILGKSCLNRRNHKCKSPEAGAWQLINKFKEGWKEYGEQGGGIRSLSIIGPCKYLGFNLKEE